MGVAHIGVSPCDVLFFMDTVNRIAITDGVVNIVEVEFLDCFGCLVVRPCGHTGIDFD